MPLDREFLIEQGSCCGCRCLNCVYLPKWEVGSTTIDPKIIEELNKNVEENKDKKVKET